MHSMKEIVAIGHRDCRIKITTGAQLANILHKAIATGRVPYRVKPCGLWPSKPNLMHHLQTQATFECRTTYIFKRLYYLSVYHYKYIQPTVIPQSLLLTQIRSHVASQNNTNAESQGKGPSIVLVCTSRHVDSPYWYYYYYTLAISIPLLLSLTQLRSHINSDAWSEDTDTITVILCAKRDSITFHSVVLHVVRKHSWKPFFFKYLLVKWKSHVRHVHDENMFVCLVLIVLKLHLGMMHVFGFCTKALSCLRHVHVQCCCAWNAIGKLRLSAL